MRIVQTVFGVFHHFELARQLNRRGHLQRIYSTWPWTRLKREGLPRELVETFPWVHTPEILMQRFGIHHPYLMDQISYANSLSFDEWTLRRTRAAATPNTTPDAVIAISGSSLKTGSEIQSRGGRLICDRGSSHQRYQETIVSDEYQRWNVTRPVTDIRDILREEKIYAISDAITVPSSFAARSFIEMGLPAEKIHVIPYGVRLENFTRTGEPPDSNDRFEVLFAGSVTLRKGVPYLLEAFAKLRHPAKRLRLAGSIHPDMKTVLDRLPQQQVEFLGPLPQEQLATVMSTSHVMVLPSIEEGLALVQGQALACGCPVLCSTNTGGEDLFTNGVEGFVVPVRDAAALTQRMQQLADDPGLQSQMSEAALRRVQLLGGWDDYGDRWESLLKRLTAKDIPHKPAHQTPPPTK
ncbi:glycosyltransferase family 4 protein [Tunturiibacter empetritectus]|uniref:Glycosyltransferase involved in cell wall biosynthesis n=2 Tax=Tunturiibacter TaxID=3154218 RepID=A0A852VGQ8_9BACT|nr:glycosyltransferase family 4 protein [Edaphobacter lichenicola]NYF89624.1 glycosyltransferase involved in cell wall biosynthesis [Edaphobacter lichenicola]